MGYELAGFVWYHGWNDGVDPKNAVPEYEKNLVNLINDVRKNLKTPKLPVVVGELTGPWVKAPGAWDTLRNADRAQKKPTWLNTHEVFGHVGLLINQPTSHSGVPFIKSPDHIEIFCGVAQGHLRSTLLLYGR